MEMEQAQVLQILEGDSSEVLVPDWEKTEAVKLIAASILTLAIPTLIASWLGLMQILWVIPLVVGYGLYLGLTNEVVFYADNKDIWNIAGMGAAPIGVLFVVGSFMPSDTNSFLAYIVGFIMLAGMAASAAWFGIKSCNATVLMNIGVDFPKLVAVSVSKVILVFVFAFLMIGSLNKALKGDNPADLGKGLVVFAIVVSIAAWLRPRIVNTQRVFEKRGMVF